MKSAWFIGLAFAGFLAGCGDDTDVMLTTVNPASKWIVQPSRAEVRSEDNGESWDIDGSAPDVVVKINCPSSGGGSSSGETDEVESYTPTWSGGNCTARADDLVNDGVDFEVRDVDTSLDPDDGIAEASISLREEDLIAGTVTITRVGDLESFTVTLTEQ